MKHDKIIEAQIREPKKSAFRLSSEAMVSLAWLALLAFGGHRTDGDLWYLNVIVFGFPAYLYLLIKGLR